MGLGRTKLFMTWNRNVVQLMDTLKASACLLFPSSMVTSSKERTRMQ